MGWARLQYVYPSKQMPWHIPAAVRSGDAGGPPVSAPITHSGPPPVSCVASPGQTQPAEAGKCQHLAVGVAFRPALEFENPQRRVPDKGPARRPSHTPRCSDVLHRTAILCKSSETHAPASSTMAPRSTRSRGREAAMLAWRRLTEPAAPARGTLESPTAARADARSPPLPLQRPQRYHVSYCRPLGPIYPTVINIQS